jgi:hypothetical protein
MFIFVFYIYHPAGGGIIFLIEILSKKSYDYLCIGSGVTALLLYFESGMGLWTLSKNFSKPSQNTI